MNALSIGVVVILRALLRQPAGADGAELGDVDADWESAYSVGDEAPGGDNPTPDQDIVDDIGRALGNEYQDNEPLKGADKIAQRDKHRWELDPGSKEDFDDREVEVDLALEDDGTGEEDDEL